MEFPWPEHVRTVAPSLGPVIGIYIATYQRADGSTPLKLAKALQSVINQTYTRWHVYLVGDCYDNPKEFKKLASLLPSNQCTTFNMSEPGERGKVQPVNKLWGCAGSTAMNKGIELGQEDGRVWMAHLDDDDFWDGDHLSLLVRAIKQFPEATFVFTQAQFGGTPRFPTSKFTQPVLNEQPMGGRKLIHSAMCMNVTEHKERYRTDHNWYSDADLWERVNKEPGFASAFVSVVTVHHLSEGAGYTAAPKKLPQECIRLHLGCGENTIPGWVNLGIDPGWKKDPVRGSKVLKWDMSKRPFPISDNCVYAIYSQHMLQRFDLYDGLEVLRECYRILIPGGRMRLCLPGLDDLIRLMQGDQTVATRLRSLYGRMLPCALFNRVIYGEALNGWKMRTGKPTQNVRQRFYYTATFLQAILREIGFKDVHQLPHRKSAFMELENRETRRFVIDICVEGVKA